MSVPDSVYALVEKFESGKARFKNPQYNETALRVEFINPFFEALGWNVRDSAQVSHEDRVMIEGKPKRPDYGFRIGGATRFFLETKKPSLNLKNDPSPAYQLRRYGWSGNLPLSVLSDFEEFTIYDCRIQPQRFDPASKGRLEYYQYPEYVDNWDKLYGLFSREAVADGALRDWIGEEKTRGALGVDQAFLREMEIWREALAKDIALHNDLRQRDLNHLVQRTIDRLVFLRIAEDRGIEIYGRLRSIAGEGRQVYQGLKLLFIEADDKYNSGLFHFGHEERSSAPDRLSLSIHISDDTLRQIIKNLYYPNSPYEFSVLPADILGQVYERFLGKVIELTDTGLARVEDKPEVRKAGGVYYTPTYIVDYIVENTVGKLLEGKTPKEAEKLRILDPACGSGSFLTGAYQCLLNWHLNYYSQEPERHRNTLRRRVDGYVLTTQEKRRILQNNIYGVDLDQNAVEVSKLSLLLKMLENEDGSDATGLQTAMFAAGGRILPDLSNNIKWGNSLIGSDFYAGKQMELFSEEEVLKVKPFDWESREHGFGEIMAAGGFDAVIGNPPYGAWYDTEQGTYLANNFSAFAGVKDVYVAFIVKALKLAKSHGRVSCIVPSAWTGGPRYRNVRGFLIDFAVENIVLLPYDVFADAYVDTLVFVLRNEECTRDHQVSTYVYGKREKLSGIELSEKHWDVITQKAWLEIDDQKFVLDSQTMQILSKIDALCTNQLGDIVAIKRGVLFDKTLLTESNTSAESHPYFEGDIYRYRGNHFAVNWIEFDDRIKEKPKEFAWFEGERILLRRLVNRRQRLMANLVKETFVTNKNLYSVLSISKISLQVVLALLNSTLFSYLYLKQVTQATKDDFPQVTIRDIKSLPIPRTVRLETASDKLIELVDRMLDLHKQIQRDNVILRGTIELQIERTDREIDHLVYKLYDLTPEEIAIVEGRGN